MWGKSSNPAFNSRALEGCAMVTDKPMTINGTIGKTLILLGIAVLSGGFSVYGLLSGNIPANNIGGLLIASAILSFVLALITIFNPKNAKIFAPFYALTEGAFLGIITMFFEAKYHGIAFQAVSLTVLSMFGMLCLYRLNLIRATEKFRSTIMMATFAIAFLYLINFIGQWVSFLHIPMIADASLLGIGFSILICVIASLSFIIDFDNIEIATRNFVTKELEWYYGFGLMVTLVWLYIEVLRLLMKLNDRG